LLKKAEILDVQRVGKMKIINNTEITGFLNIGNEPILIKDFRFIDFYDTRQFLKRVEKFNLPAGKFYLLTGNVIRMNKPVKYAEIKLPPIERKKRLPENFEIKFANNPNKCTIFWDMEKIIFDENLRNKPLYVLFQLLYHEFGHAFYSTEKYADLFALNYMLKRGFNPSQVGWTQLTALSEMNYERKKYIVDKIIQYEKSKYTGN